MQMSLKFLGRSTVLCFIVALAGCAANHTSSKTEYKTSANFTPIKNVLIVAVGKDKYHTMEVENAIGEELKKEGVNSLSAHTKIKEEEAFNKEMILALVNEYNLDSVMVSRIVHANINRLKANERTELVVDRPSTHTLADMFFYVVYDGETTYQKEISTTSIIATDVFAADDETKLITLETNVTGVQDIHSKVVSSASHVVSELKKQKLID
jgi:hypothetical protein